MAAAATTQRQPLQHAHKLYAVEQQAGNSNSPASVSGNSSERSKAARQRRKTRPFPVSDAEKRKEGGMEGERARVHGESEKGHESEPRSASASLTSVAILSHAWISSNETVTAHKNKEGSRKMRKGW